MLVTVPMRGRWKRPLKAVEGSRTMSFDPRIDMLAHERRGRLLGEAAQVRLIRSVDDDESRSARPQPAGMGQAIKKAVSGLFGTPANRRAAPPLACAADTVAVEGQVGGII